MTKVKVSICAFLKDFRGRLVKLTTPLKIYTTRCK